MKQRSKSAERAGSGEAFSDDFQEKLREWSVKQGYHPTYYSDLRASQGYTTPTTLIITRAYA